MTRDHRPIEALLAVDALGGLDGDDLEALERELATHGSDCAECLDLKAGFAETAAMLGLTLDPEPVDPSLVGRIVAVSRVPQTRFEPALSRPKRDRGRRIAVSVIGIAASVMLLVVGAAILRPDVLAIDRVTAAQRFVSFDGERGELALAYTPGKPGVVVVGSQLPEPPSGHAYELWTFEGDTPVSAGCLVPDDGRVGQVLPDVEPTATMAVTVEPGSCPSAPTGDIVFTATIV